MKSKRIDDPNRGAGHGGDFTNYVVQTGCYMWTSRAYHRESYIVQRGEKRDEAEGIFGAWEDTSGIDGIRGDTEAIDGTREGTMKIE